MAGGCDSIRIPKTETALDVRRVEETIAAAEEEFHMESGRTAFRLEEGEPLQLMIYDSEYTLTADGLSVPRP